MKPLWLQPLRALTPSIRKKSAKDDRGVRHKKRVSEAAAELHVRAARLEEWAQKQLKPDNLGRSMGRERQLSFHP